MKLRTRKAKHRLVQNWCNQHGGTTCKISEWAASKLKTSYAKFSARYGKKGAIAIMAAMAATMPIPGNILAVLGVAEGVRAVATRITGNASINDIVEDVRDLAEQLGLDFDEQSFVEAYQREITTNESRIDMPQIRKEHFEDFLDYIRQHTTLDYEDAVDPHDLNAIQSEYSQERVDAIPDEKLEWPILVSKDGYVLDGNHRWIRAGQKGVTIPVLRIGLNRDDALELARSFPQAEYVRNWCNQYGGDTCRTSSPNAKEDEGTEPRDRPDREIHHLGVKRVVEDLKKSWKYKGEVRVLDQDGPQFERGGVQWREGGNCVLSTGLVTIHSGTAGESVEAIERLTAHEFMHGAFEKAYQQYDEDRRQLRGDQIKANGELKPEYKDQYPTYSRMHYFREAVPIDQFIKDDGVSPYSEAYWRDYKDGKVTFHIAVHETLAEIAGIHQQTGVLHGSKLYRDYYKAVRDEYRVLTGSQRARRGVGVTSNQDFDHVLYLTSDLLPIEDLAQAVYLRWWRGSENGWATKAAPVKNESLAQRLTARAKRKLARNARKPGVGPNKIDPTMTASLRRGFIAKVRAKFALLRGRLRKLVVEEDAFGLQAGNDLKMAHNAFCPTGAGGGQDNSCSPTSTPSEEDTGNFLERIESGELDDSDPRVSEIGAALTDEHSKSVAKDSSGKIVAAISYRKGKFATEIHQLGSLQKGLGRTLIDRLGPGKLIAKTVRDEARGFYERLGFRPSRQNPEDMVREPTTNRYQFETSPEKIKKFQEWLRQQFRSTITGKTDEQLWKEYAKQGYMKGAGRAFDDVQGPRRRRRFAPGEGDFYQGSRAEFLRSSFARPETVEKIQLLAGRSFDDLENVTEDMATRMSRTLTDGLSQGMNPREVARLLDDDLELGGNRAEVIARTEIIRAHAEGQLDSMKAMGVQTVGAEVEWSTAGDLRVCPECSEMEGKIYSIEDARGLIPMHPQCRCAWLPAGFDKLMEEPTDNAFCPTGPGGGQVNTCPPANAGTAVHKGSGLPIGHTYLKTYKGTTYQVVVNPNGFDVVGPNGTQSYPSLTAAAKGLRGNNTAINGWAFFGIDKPAGSAPSSTATQPTSTPASAAPKDTIPYTPEHDFTTGKAEPGVLNGIPFSSAPPKFWEKTPDKDVGEHAPVHKIERSSVLIQEPDGRVWIVQPTNQFGDRRYTIPGGTNEPHLSNQQNALKEIWEETGLQVEITGHLGDFQDSNNGRYGRLYVGKRIGGAPWEAKIENSIRDKNGNPAAESERVTLVTPELAAQRLHRTDDLAQIATLQPIKVNTLSHGNMMKKLVEGMKPAAKSWERRQTAAGRSPSSGDSTLHAAQELRGFNAQPTVVSRSSMDALVAQGTHIEMLRGVKGAGSATARQLADEFKTGDHFPGHGCFGSGTYADSTRGLGNVADQYGRGGDIIRMAIPKSAKIIKQSELENLVGSPPSTYSNPSHHSSSDSWLGVQATLAGYDAIHVDGNGHRHGSYGMGFYVILNRGIVTVQKESAKGHIIS